MNYVIVGCGAAGIKAATTIREYDKDGDITLVSNELWPMYLKPTLADFISGKIDFSRMTNKATTDLERLNIRVLTGKRVTAVRTEKNQLEMSDSTVLDYQFLLIATGSAPVIPDNLRPFKDSFRVLNSLSDAVRIKNDSQRGNKAVVIGGGHHALEMLRALHHLKFDLTFLSDKESFWEPDHPISSNDVLALLEQKKIQTHWNMNVVDIIDLDGESYRIVLRDGKTVDTQMILFAPYFKPNISLVAGSVIKTDKGILVSEDLRTSVPNVFACGDVAQVYDLNKGINKINFGWTSAAKQGEIAGQNMAGRDTFFLPTKEEYFRHLYGAKLIERW